MKIKLKKRKNWYASLIIVHAIKQIKSEKEKPKRIVF